MLEVITANLPIILCCLFGIGLLLVEVFMPGFGLPGISGIILEIIGLVLTYRAHGWLATLGLTILLLAIIGIAVSLSLRSAAKGRLSKSPVILNESETAAEGYNATQDMEIFVGRSGVAKTVLRPAGMAEFDGVKLDVVADGEYIAKGSAVRVDHVEGARIVVRKIDPADQPSENAQP